MITDIERFESLGDNCEFGFFLRDKGIEKSSLFRWTLTHDINNLEYIFSKNFEDLYLFENLEPAWQNMVLDKKYGLSFHTEMYSVNNEGIWEWKFDAEENLKIYSKEKEKIKYFLEELRRSIMDDKKIFILKSNDNNGYQGALALSTYLEKNGRAKVLYVRSSENPDYSITKINNHLYLANIDRFAPYNRANDYSNEGWTSILKNAINEIN
ncbi:hypothetical protein [Rosenbergiella collisarenosi]|uniref:hypothetical protein n=1 Tax=Rosenbergiella collisarenosi TaxID=1544695 RepID=UPI001F4D6151|nr:hypothetical protein [Rosenbergiella collisarenosi]